jgi:hypothetical protein
MHDISRDAKGGTGASNIGKDNLEEKQKNNQSQMTDVQTEMEWNVDIMSGDALHSALYVYKKHFEEGHAHFVDTMKEQNSALRSLFDQILSIETQINETYEYFSGEPIQHLPYETEEGRLHYEELQRIQREKLERDSKSGALDDDPLLDDDEDDEENTTDEEETDDENDGEEEEQ